jgi:hypothetical protein
MIDLGRDGGDAGGEMRSRRASLTSMRYAVRRMKDSEVRGIILQRLYDIRHSNDGMIDIPDGLAIMNVPAAVLANCAAQLDEQGLIKFQEYLGRGYRAGGRFNHSLWRRCS